MEGPAPTEPPAARPAVGAVALLIVVLLVAWGGWLGYQISTSGPEPPEGTAGTGPTCATPPTAPTTAPTFATAPDPSVAGARSWQVRVRTSCGDILLVLDGARAPRSVASFVMLARAGYWTDSVCQRLTTRLAPTAFLQCGDPTGRGTADPGYDLPLENVPAGHVYRVGDVGMARGDETPGTAGEFFVVHEDFTLPPGTSEYSLIGRVVAGQDVVQHVASRGGEDGQSDWHPFQSVSVLTVEVSPR